MGISQFDEQKPVIAAVSWGDSDFPAPVSFWGYDGRILRLDSITITTDDTVDNALIFWVFHHTFASGILGTIPIPAGAGTDPLVPAVDAMPLLAPTLLAFFGTIDEALGAAPLAAPSSGKFIYVTAQGGVL